MGSMASSVLDSAFEVNGLQCNPGSSVKVGGIYHHFLKPEEQQDQIEEGAVNKRHLVLWDDVTFF